jgi:transposase
VNANLLRKWVVGQQRQQRNGVAVGAIECATEVFVPVVELCGVAGPPEPPVPPSVQHHVQPSKAGRHTDPPAPRLTVEMPNGVTLRLECGGQDVELVSAMIVTLGRCDVPAGR